MATYYETLGISNDADEAAIKKAYRKLYLQWHPDKNPHRREEAERRFKEMAEAQETLTDSIRKAAYDRYLSRGHDVAVEAAQAANQQASALQTATEEMAARRAAAPTFSTNTPEEPVMEGEVDDEDDDSPSYFSSSPTSRAHFNYQPLYTAFFQSGHRCIILISPVGIFLLSLHKNTDTAQHAASSSVPYQDDDMTESNPFLPQPQATSQPKSRTTRPTTPATQENLRLEPIQSLETIYARTKTWFFETGLDEQGFSCRWMTRPGQAKELVIDLPLHAKRNDQQAVIDFLKQSDLVQERSLGYSDQQQADFVEDETIEEPVSPGFSA